MVPNRPIFARTVVLLMLALTASAQSRYILRAGPGQINKVVQEYGLTVVSQMSGSAGNLAVVAAPASANAAQLLAAIARDPAVQWVEADQQVTLPKKSNVATNPASGLFALAHDWAASLSPLAWAGYLAQPAVNTIGLPAAHKIATGAGTVAFLDTGADFTNPVLLFNLLPGVDFTTSAPAMGQETPTLNQSTTSILDSDAMLELDQSTTSILDYSSGGCDPVVGCANQSTTSILDQSTTSILDRDTRVTSAYGHGTMIAGLIHLVAPTARLMPVKVFGDDGTAQLSTMLQGLYYAVDHGAKVINMSFSMTAPSAELEKALDAANDAGVICVAAVGNEGQQMLVYPAGYPEAIGVGSTNNQGVRSSFSNYGPVVTLAAPGEEMISTYPGNRYAAGWGTSFSTPLVTGGVALLVQLDSTISPKKAQQALSQADPLGQGLGAGELDLVKALQYVNVHGGGN